MTDKPAKPARKRTSSTRRTTKAAPKIQRDAIATRAYFIHLEEGPGDPLENWLRAERELAAA